MTTEQQVLDRIDRTRRARPRLRSEHVTLAHGAGGKASRALVDAVFLDALCGPDGPGTLDGPGGPGGSGGPSGPGGPGGPALAELEDSAVVTAGGATLAISTDSFVVSPLFFPGGSIGDLAVNGTVNDLAMAGARPLYLSAAFVLEEGFPVADLRRIAADMAAAARRAEVAVVTGDTKVVQHGRGDGCYLTTTGVGLVPPGVRLGARNIRPGDTVIVSGPVGDHGTTVMLARGELDLSADLTSDTAPLTGLVEALLSAVDGVRCLRDATRGGVATILNEWAQAAEVGIVLTEDAVPVRPQVRGACEILGIDPLYVACEGRFVAAVDPADADAALAALRAHPDGADAAIVGTAVPDPPAMVLLKTGFGGTRVVDMLVGDPLPRIC